MGCKFDGSLCHMPLELAQLYGHTTYRQRLDKSPIPIEQRRLLHRRQFDRGWIFSQPKQLTIGTGTGIALTDLGTDSTAIDTFFIDYSLVGTALDSGNSSITRYYNQVGTLIYNANPLSQTDAGGNINGSVTIQDVSSSSHDYHANGNVYYSGAVEFNGSMANGTVNITADNNVSPPTSNVVMKYVVRKWKSQ